MNTRTFGAKCLRLGRPRKSRVLQICTGQISTRSPRRKSSATNKLGCKEIPPPDKVMRLQV
jgi:hypothetical protein